MSIVSEVSEVKKVNYYIFITHYTHSTHVIHLFCFLMSGMFLASRAIFAQLKSVFNVFLVLNRCVISFLAIFTSKNYHSVIFTFDTHLYFFLFVCCIWSELSSISRFRRILYLKNVSLFKRECGTSHSRLSAYGSYNIIKIFKMQTIVKIW